MSEPSFGIIFNDTSTATLPPYTVDLSVLGTVLPSDDADPSVFPLNQPVDVNTGDPTFLAAAGTGPLYDLLRAVNAQMTDLEVSARMVVVRVAMGKNGDGTENIPQTIANIVGDPGQQTGIYALKRAAVRLGITPRILGFPGVGSAYTGLCQTQGGTQGVTAGPKAGIVGNGQLTLASTALGNAAQVGTYLAKCVGGAFTATGAAAQGNVGNGVLTMAGTSADTTAKAGIYTVSCIVAAPNGGEFLVQDPANKIVGAASVGQPFAKGVHFTIADGSADFAVGDQFVITAVASVPANGGAFQVTDPSGTVVGTATVGTAFTGTQVNFTIADGTTDFALGDTFAIVVTTSGGQLLANPLCAALPEVLNALLAHAVVGGPGTTKTAAIAWRGTLNSPRLIPVDNWHIIAKGTDTAFQDGAAQAMGIAVANDFAHGGIPAWSWANQPVQNIEGVKREDSYSLFDGATDGQELLAVGVGVTVRGDLSDSSLDDSGWQFIAYNNASTGVLNLYNKTRMRDYTNIQLAKSIRKRLGKENITPHDVQAVINDMTAINTALMANYGILGFQVGFNPARNTKDNLRAGKFVVFDNTEEAAPILQVTIDRGVDDDALTTEIAELAALGTSATS